MRYLSAQTAHVGVQHNLAALQRAGIRVAIDDVGAGNAGLRLLSRSHGHGRETVMPRPLTGGPAAASLHVGRRAGACDDGQVTTRSQGLVIDGAGGRPPGVRG